MAAGIVKRPLAHGGVVYWVVFTWQKRQVWERAGLVEREAQRLLTRRRREVKEGTYLPAKEKKATSFGQYARQWVENRATRTREDDERWIYDYVLPLKWLDELSLVDLAPKHMAKLVEDLKSTKGKRTGKPLSPKSVANIYGIVSTMVRDARIAELVPSDPCVLPKGTLTRRSRNRRTPYEARDVAALLMDERVASDVRVWIALAFLTGMREGEVCGRRWRDYDPHTKPLGSLSVATQYEDLPLKTDEDGEARPRMVPVHPVLAWLLERWRSLGFELVHRRKPAPDDFIVPNRDGSGHTRSSAYKMFRRALAKVGIANRSLHATRNTFITMCRRGGARKDFLERVTHNATGDVVDAYTHWDWDPLCEAVLCLTIDSWIDRDSGTLRNVVEAPGIEPRAREARLSSSNALDDAERVDDPPKSGANGAPDVGHGARHGRRVEAPGHAERPGPSVVRAPCDEALDAIESAARRPA